MTAKGDTLKIIVKDVSLDKKCPQLVNIFKAFFSSLFDNKDRDQTNISYVIIGDREAVSIIFDRNDISNFDPSNGNLTSNQRHSFF